MTQFIAIRDKTGNGEPTGMTLLFVQHIRQAATINDSHFVHCSLLKRNVVIMMKIWIRCNMSAFVSICYRGIITITQKLVRAAIWTLIIPVN